MSEQDAVRDMLTEAKIIHEEWAEYFEKYPSAEKTEEHKKLGDAVFHRKWAKNYETAIKCYAELQAENKKLKSMLGEEFSPETCELICTDTKQLQAENVELRSKIERLRSDIQGDRD